LSDRMQEMMTFGVKLVGLDQDIDNVRAMYE
jgi:hypothetical protein